jgi:hypothetical protein
LKGTRAKSPPPRAVYRGVLTGRLVGVAETVRRALYGRRSGRAAHSTLADGNGRIVHRLSRRLWSRNWYRRRRLRDRRWPSRIWRRDPRCSRRRVRRWTLSMHSVETPACAGLIRWPSTGGNRLYDWAASSPTRSRSSATWAIRSHFSASSNSRVLIASVVAVAAKDRSRAALRRGWFRKSGIMYANVRRRLSFDLLPVTFLRHPPTKPSGTR